MRNFHIFFMLMVGAFALVGCNSTMDDKAEVDAAYSVGNLPTIVLTSVDEGGNMVTVNGALSDVSKVVEVGVRVSESADMTDAVIWENPSAAAEFEAVAKKLKPESTYYVQVYFVSKDNRMGYSDVVEVQTTELTFSPSVLDGATFEGECFSLFSEDAYTMSVSVELDEEDNTKVIFKNLDPYLYDNGVDAESGGNILEGTADWENMVITIPRGQMMGYEDVFMTGLESEDEEAGYDDIYISIEDFGETLVIQNPLGACSDDGFLELYGSAIILSKK